MDLPGDRTSDLPRPGLEDQVCGLVGERARIEDARQRREQDQEREEERSGPKAQCGSRSPRASCSTKRFDAIASTSKNVRSRRKGGRLRRPRTWRRLGRSARENRSQGKRGVGDGWLWNGFSERPDPAGPSRFRRGGACPALASEAEPDCRAATLPGPDDRTRSARPSRSPLFVVIWATGFIVARLVAPYADPLTFLLVRYLLAISSSHVSRSCCGHHGRARHAAGGTHSFRGAPARLLSRRRVLVRETWSPGRHCGAGGRSAASGDWSPRRPFSR